MTGPDYGAPIFHVNGDDPEAVVRACRLAVDYRYQWGADVVVNLVCYRRLGHNEQDDPSITLPIRAQAIAAQPRVAESYAAQLVADGDATEEEAGLLGSSVIHTLHRNSRRIVLNSSCFKPSATNEMRAFPSLKPQV